MNPSKNNKELLFQKYIKGEISKDEMHLLNLYALEDEFLFEALEGLSGFEDQTSMAIKELSTKFASKKKRKRRSLLLYWFSAAASVAIIVVSVTVLNNGFKEAVSGGKVVDQVIKPKTQDVSESIAYTVEKDKSPHETPLLEAEADPMEEKSFAVSTKPENKKLEAVESDWVRNEEEIANIEEAQIAEVQERELEELSSSSIKLEPTVSKAEVPPSAPVVVSRPAPANAKGKKKRSKELNPNRFSSLPAKRDQETDAADDLALAQEGAILHTIMGSVRSSDGEQLIGSIISSPSNGSTVTVSSDIDGNFEMQVTDPNGIIVVNAQGYLEKTVPINRQRDLDIVLESSPKTEIEVVFLYDKTVSDPDTAELEDFRNYAGYRMQFSDDVMEQISDKFITLEFDVNNNGYAKNIIVVDSVGYGVEEEAMKIVDSYNKWKLQNGVSNVRKKIKLLFSGK